MNNNKLNNYSIINSGTIAFLFSYIYLFIDAINGQLIRNISISISPLLKLILLSLMIHYLLKFKSNKIILYIIPFIIIIFIHFIYLRNINYIIDDFMWAFKFLAIIISFHFFKHHIIYSNNSIKKIDFLFKISFFVILSNILLGISGFGYALYGRENIGTKGYFMAGNELGITLIVCSMYLLALFINQRKIKLYFIFSILYLFISINLGSKVAVLGAIIIITIFPVIDFFKRHKYFIINKTSLKLASISFVFLFVFAPIGIYYLLYEIDLLSRMSFFFNKYNLITFLLSGRDLRAIEIIEYSIEHMNLFTFLFGFSLGTLKHSFVGTSEIDLVDLFFVYGITGVTIIYGFFIYILLKSKKMAKSKKTDYIYARYVYVGTYLLLFLSLFSGHVMMSGLAGILIGAFFSLIYIKKEINNEKI